jgi:hypothetical protein
MENFDKLNFKKLTNKNSHVMDVKIDKFNYKIMLWMKRLINREDQRIELTTSIKKCT